MRLLDLHRSDPFGFNTDLRIDEDDLPEGWMPPVESKLTYTKSRDIHAAGIVLLQMLLGRDVMERYPDPQTALRLCKIGIPLCPQFQLTSVKQRCLRRCLRRLLSCSRHFEGEA